jgi:hypothetical protein
MLAAIEAISSRLDSAICISPAGYSLDKRGLKPTPLLVAL